MDHFAIAVNVAAMQVKEILCHLGRNVRIIARLPWPVWGSVVQAQKEGLLILARDIFNRSLGE